MTGKIIVSKVSLKLDLKIEIEPKLILQLGLINLYTKPLTKISDSFLCEKNYMLPLFIEPKDNIFINIMVVDTDEIFKKDYNLGRTRVYLKEVFRNGQLKE